MPPTLMARAGLAIVVPLILVQVISTYIFYDNHMYTVSRRMASGLAGDVAAVTAFLRDHPSDEDQAWIAENAKRTMDLTVHVEHGARLAGPGVVTRSKDADDALEETLWDTLHSPFLVDMTSYRTAKQISIFVQLPSGLLHVLAPRSRIFTSTTYVFVIWMVGSSLLLFGVAAVFLRGQVQSVRRLAQAADEFGKGREVPDFPPEGAFEVRQVARAFNIMRNRIRRQLAQRMEMLAGVSHDLRTPLTRMKLQLAMMGGALPEDVTALRDDLNEMERMLDAYLAFARGEGSEEATATDLTGLLETIVARFRREGAVVGLTADHLPMGIRLKPTAFERCLGNLIANAIRHGSAVDVSARRVARSIEIYVDDDGPGIPAAKREEVFRAFHRLEPSRNPRTGGIGLGLTVARDIVRGMGGDIILSDSPRGGLRATVSIPI
ncbi:MAG: HAMP domain-containing protein [Rhodospirillaceae bacterium]|nr:MAG: HAMP domain-containing protein [Rhodospirillaceae bacterium]